MVEQGQRPAQAGLRQAIEQAGQRFGHFLGQQTAEGPWRQLATAHQRLQGSFPPLGRVFSGIHRGHLVLYQFVVQAPAVQATERKRLDVLARGVVPLQVHRQPLLQEAAHRLGQKVAQLNQVQRLSGWQRRQRQTLCRVRPQGSGAGGIVFRPPFARVAEQARVSGLPEIGLVKRLHAVPDRQRCQQPLPGLVGRHAVITRQPPPLRQVVTQLRHQHRGRPLGQVVDAVATPADDQAVACRQQGLQEQVAVVLAARAVAGSPVVGHEIEVHRRTVARIVAVVHAQQGHQPERDGAHGHERGHGDPAPDKGLLQAVLVQTLQPVLAHHGQRQRFVQAGGFAGLQPVFERAVQPLQRERVAPLSGAKAVGQQASKVHTPAGRRPGFGHGLPVHLQGLQQTSQCAQRGRFQAAHLVHRFDAAPGLARPRRVAQQQASQTQIPGVLAVQCRQAQRLALRRMQSPAHPRSRHPATQQRQVVFIDIEAGTQGRHFQPIEHLAHRHPSDGQRQQPLQRAEQRVVPTLRAVDQVKGDVARIAGCGLAEHRLHMGRIRRHVGHHDDDVARLQRRVAREGVEQLVVQRLDFALRAVRHLEAQ